MELTLDLQHGTLVQVLCDSQRSHTFDLQTLALPDETAIQAFRDRPENYGKKLYDALFPPDTHARRTLAASPERVLLVALQKSVDAIPWEYTYGLYGNKNQAADFLVLSVPFVRGLPPDQRRTAPDSSHGLHIIAVPSSPLSRSTEQLPIERDWHLLQEVIEDVPRVMTLERCRPPTLKRLRELVANQAEKVIHFIGHGGQREEGAILCFEQENADLHEVTTRQLLKRVQGTAFLVTLSACVSASPGPTTWSNVAQSLVHEGVPYALGMRDRVYDVDARAFFRMFYSELARGSSVEQALFQARLVLAEDSPRRWVVGVPILYTSLARAAPGVFCPPGAPAIKDMAPSLNVDVLPPPDGVFQGRLEELVALGTACTNPRPPGLLTIHGAGGQGKTALARAAAERFAWAWPGGIWALSLEKLLTRPAVVQEMARLLRIDTQEIADPEQVEALVQQHAQHRRVLFLLDNAETLLDAIEQDNAEARAIAAWLKHLLAKNTVMYLVTSRSLLSWPNEHYLELSGLQPDDGATLFEHAATPRSSETDWPTLRALSCLLDGHPLSLRLLASVFGESQQSLKALVDSAEVQLRAAHDKYLGQDHRHYQLYACLNISLRALDKEHRDVLSALWVFHSPFLAQTAVEVLEPEREDTEEHPSPIRAVLHHLWKRSLLTRQTLGLHEGEWHFYAILPTTRPYLEQDLEQAYERSFLLSRFGQAYASLTSWIYQELGRGASASHLAQRTRLDLDRGWEYVSEDVVSGYLHRWGWIVYRLGNASQGRELLERALESVQGDARPFLATVMSTLALVYSNTGQPQRALELYEEALPILRAVGDRAGEAATLNNLAFLYQDFQRYSEALEAFDTSIQRAHEIMNPTAEIAGWVGRAQLLSASFHRAEDALLSLEHAQEIFRLHNLSHDAAGRTLDDVEQLRERLMQGKPLAHSQDRSAPPASFLTHVVENTRAALACASERRAEWEEQVRQLLASAHEHGEGWQQEAELFTVLLALLEGREAHLPNEHPYIAVIEAIQQGEGAEPAGSGTSRADLPGSHSVSDDLLQAMQEFCTSDDWLTAQRVVEARQALLFQPVAAAVFQQHIAHARTLGEERLAHQLEIHLALLLACQRDGIEAAFAALRAQGDETPWPFDPEVIPRSIAALVGGPPEKYACFQYLLPLAAQTTDDAFRQLLAVIQQALVGADSSQLGQGLAGRYKDAWVAILKGIESEKE